MPLRPDRRNYIYTGAGAGALVWSDVLFEGDTKFGDTLRVMGVPVQFHGPTAGQGIGVGWNPAADEETFGEFHRRITALHQMLADVQDTHPMDKGHQILDIFHACYGQWHTSFFHRWRGDEADIEGKRK